MSARIQRADRDQPVVNDVGKARWSANVSLQEMVEAWIVEQRRNLFNDVDPDLRLAACDLLPPVDQKENILGIAAGDEIAFAASALCLQFSRDKQLQREAPDLERLLELFWYGRRAA
ncbi:hypothetical protein NKI78_23935 [Mesorhizobium sp. M0400]|uniref:hypothetical protein n=1 Tax=Mesorhizobium sp. M0400 TaxID=2956941 RepID=UPI00333AE0A1